MPEPSGPAGHGATRRRGPRAQVFTGEYHVAVDDKGRIAIPVRFRTEFDAGAFLSRWIDPCLALHPRVAWEAITSRVEPLPVTDEGARLFRHFLYPSAWPIEQDKQGRLVIPGKLRDAVGLTGDKAVLVGAGSHLELWSPERWDELSARMAQPGFLEDQFKGLGI